MAAFNEQVDELIVKHLQGTLTPAEEAELTAWINADETNKLIFDQVTDATFVREAMLKIRTYDRQRIWERVRAQMQMTPEADIIPMRRTSPWKKLAVAASIIGAIAFAGYWLMKDKTTDNGPQTTVVQTNDVKAPDKNRAQIKLADGRIVYLDSAGNGELVNANGVVVKKTEDGKIVYEKADGSSTTLTVSYNTLSNPRGSKVIDMTLSDGSRVWLNAGSSLTYPVAFIGKERKVSITGEAYFEIAHDKTKPFTVSKGEMKVEVLGTHFNVNAYDDEENIKVTLLEGSVKVSSVVSRQSSVLKPGQQAIAAVDGGLRTVDGIDLETVMSWKNGRFIFKSADIESIMREVARWYDVEIVYEEKVNQKFNGKIPRSMSAMNVFKVLEETGGVHFKIEGKKVVVSK
jgi:transmembrane sensor